MKPNLNRRSLLVAAGGLAGVSLAGVGLSILACNWNTPLKGTKAASLGRLFDGMPEFFDPLQIGNSVRASFADDQAMIAHVSDHSVLTAAGNISCDPKRVEFLQRAFKQDFAEQKVSEIDGWLLSESECLITGLFAWAVEISLHQAPGAVV